MSWEPSKVIGWEIRVVESRSSWHAQKHGHSRTAEVRGNRGGCDGCRDGGQTNVFSDQVKNRWDYSNCSWFQEGSGGSYP